MSKHPYPEHVLDAVEEALRDKLYEGALPVQLAETALQSLWDASRVDDVEAMKVLPNDAIVRSDIGGEPDTPYNFIHAPYEEDYPAQVIWWGDSDA